MATVYAHTNDGYVSRFNQSSWSNARANTTGTASNSTQTNLSYGAASWKAAARGGGSTFSIFKG